jgi:Dolichyl-phosphate-mannose-protein mannosyltransferase
MKWDGEKLATRGLPFLVAYAAIRSIVCAASKPFWYDELCTVAIARQPSISAIRKALEHAADSHPPTYYFLERFADYFLPNPHIALRLFSILGFCCIVFCVFVFVRKQASAVCALLCSAMTVMSTFYDPYAVEARGYALMSACAAIALVCYQRVDRTRWVLLMGLSLAAAGAFQYYAVFALFPFAIAECAFFLQTRRPRLGVWAALAFGLLPLIVFWPLLSLLKRYYGSSFWAKPTLTGVLGVFGWFFNLSPHWGIAITAAASIGVVAIMVSEFVREDRDSHRARDLFHERVLVLGLLALPLAAFVAMKITHGGLTERYMLPAGLGLPLAAGYILPRFDRRLVALVGVFLFFGLAAQESSFWLHQRHHLGKIISPAQEVEEFVKKAGRPDLPVVVSDARDYFQLTYYGSPAWVTRLVVLEDAPKALAYSGSDNVDKQLLILRSYVPLQVYEFHDFVAKHPEFLLYSEGTMFDWWPARLVEDGCVLRLVAIHGSRKVYLVIAHDQTSHVINANIVPLELIGAGERR